MRLLFITQKIDREDTVLGFVHVWLTEFAKHFENITVLCLERGTYALPHNVSVLSLGKEGGSSRVKYVWNFFRYLVQERSNYDVVFVHMNQEYVLLGGWFWKMFGKKIFMWRNHYSGSVLTDLSALFCEKVFCTSRVSFTAKYKKTVLMPVGVDMELFHPVADVTRIPRSVLFYARTAPSKRPHMLLEALHKMHEKGVSFSASFYGSPLPRDVGYYEDLKKRVGEWELSQQTRFFSGTPYHEGPRVFSAHDIFVNLSPSGMFDKTLFEATACGCLVLACSSDFARIVDKRFYFKENDTEELTQKLQELLNLSDVEKQASRVVMRDAGMKEHSLLALAIKLKKELSC